MTIRIPAEWENHVCCWMAWAVHDEWKHSTARVKEELQTLIQEISRFEVVRLLTPPHELIDARARFSGGNVEIVEAPVDDIWMRDVAPIFAHRDGEVVAIDLNFNSWGNSRDGRPGDRLAGAASALFRVPRISTSFIAEGGAFITDGQGTLVTTKSCLLNPNRNPYGHPSVRKVMIERALRELGISRVIWLKGDSSELITSGHIDGYAMFTQPGSLLLEAPDYGDNNSSRGRREDLAKIENSSDAAGRLLQIEQISPPRKEFLRFHSELFAPCYLNAYIANGAVIAACFGDRERDEQAKNALMRSFPGRVVLMLRIDHIANGGGGIRCLTQPVP